VSGRWRDLYDGDDVARAPELQSLRREVGRAETHRHAHEHFDLEKRRELFQWENIAKLLLSDVLPRLRSEL